MKKEELIRRETKLWLVIGAILLILLLSYSIISILSQPVKIEGKMSCNTGKLGLTYNLNNSGNFTLDGINDMNCNIEYKGELPFGKLLGYLN